MTRVKSFCSGGRGEERAEDGGVNTLPGLVRCLGIKCASGETALFSARQTRLRNPHLGKRMLGRRSFAYTKQFDPSSFSVPDFYIGEVWHLLSLQTGVYRLTRHTEELADELKHIIRVSTITL